jgi:sugar phosphate isomerase/epimerase
MKIGLLVRYHQNFNEWALFADAVGIDGIEISYQDEGDYDIDPEPIKNAIKDRKVEICSIAIFHVNTLAEDPQERARAKELNCNVIDTAAEVGSKLAVIGMGYNDNQSLEANLEEFKAEHEFYNDRANKLGVTLAYYLGHPPNIATSLENIEKIIEMIPDINLKVDPVGIIRHMKIEPYEVIKAIGDIIVHFHCKDILRYDDYEIEPPVGMGQIEWNKLIAMLYDFHYDSYLVIEPHGPMWRDEDKIANHIILSKRHLEQFIP